MFLSSFSKKMAWVLYTLICLLFFVHLLFPGRSFSLFLEDKIRENSGFKLHIKDLFLVFPFTLSMDKPELYFSDLILPLDKAEFRPFFLSFLRAGSGGRADIKADYADLRLSFKKDTLSFPDISGLRGELELRDLDIKKALNLLTRELLFGSEGYLSGLFNFKAEDKDIKISGNLNFKDNKLFLDLPLMGDLSLVLFSSEVEALFQEPRGFYFEKISLSGSFGILHLNGFINLPLSSAKTLNLKGGIRPDPYFLKSLSQLEVLSSISLPFLSGGEIPLEIRGSFEKPILKVAGMQL